MASTAKEAVSPNETQAFVVGQVVNPVGDGPAQLLVDDVMGLGRSPSGNQALRFDDCALVRNGRF
jgi:hypothetical protein